MNGLHMLAGWTLVAGVIALWVGRSEVIAWMTENQALASWVQAVGSIAAILGAAAVAGWQASSGRREATQRRLEGDLAKLQAILQIIRRIAIELNYARTVIDGGRSDFDAAVERLEQVQAAISQLPAFEIPTPDLVFFLSRAHRDLFLVAQTIQRFQGNATDRHERQAMATITRVKTHVREARDHCVEKIGKVEKLQVARFS